MTTSDAAWYQSALNSMRDMVLVKGPRSKLLWANQAFLDYYGMTKEELVDIVDAEHSDPDDTLQYVIDDQRVFDSGEHLNIPSEDVTDAAGQSRAFHTVKSPIFEDGRVVGTIGVCRLLDDAEVDQRAIGHADAKAFAAPIRSLADGFPNPMLMVDVQKRILNRSPLWDKGFGAVEITPNTYFEEVYGDIPGLSEAIDTCLTCDLREPVAVPEVAPRADGPIFSVHVSPWCFPDGALGGATLVATDISALHEKQAALERANDELTHFSYRASHDLKGPLSTAKNLTGLIIEDIDDGDLEEATKNLRLVKTSMEGLEKTVLDLLALAHADLKTEESTIVSLPAVLADIQARLAHEIAEARVEVCSELSVAELSTQSTRVRQVFENLIANSIKYHNPQSAERLVRLSSTSGEGGVEVRLEDNGIGIPEEYHERAFDRFSRFHTEYPGSGLGLSIVKKHMDAIGGSISLKSSPEGTCFHLTFPAKTVRGQQ